MLQATPARSWLRAVVLWAIMASVLYGASYQQFLMFSTTNVGGLSDSISYLAMSHGNYDVDPVHRYRTVIPSLAFLVQELLGSSVKDSEIRDKLSFYVVNFIFSLATGILLHGILGRMGFNWELSLLGAIFFLTSRINVMSVGPPMVDSLYFLAVAAILYLTLTERLFLLALLTPLLVVSKETILPFLFLPFVKPSMRNWKMIASVVVALGVFYAFRAFLVPPLNAADASNTLWTIMYKQLSLVAGNFHKLFLPQGIHDLLNGFSLLAVIAMAGLVLDRRSAPPRIPSFLLLVVFIGFALGLLSGNMGRMMFVAYVPVIAYALVGIEHFCQRPEPRALVQVGDGDRSLSADMSGRPVFAVRAANRVLRNTQSTTVENSDRAPDLVAPSSPHKTAQTTSPHAHRTRLCPKSDSIAHRKDVRSLSAHRWWQSISSIDAHRAYVFPWPCVRLYYASQFLANVYSIIRHLPSRLSPRAARITSRRSA